MTADPLPSLPEGARLLHIGPHKTGSTAVQVSFHRDRAAIAEHGVHYAGSARRPRRAGWALGLRGIGVGIERPPIEEWLDLVGEVARVPGRVLVSNEDFGRARPEEVERIVADLGGDRAHVVAVTRRLDRYLPSQWQERVKAGVLASYDEWLRDVFDPASTSWERDNVWWAHDLGQLLPRWTAAVGAERFTLVVADESDRRMIHRTLEQLLALPEGLLELYPDRSNRSLSFAETELVRFVHQALDDAGWERARRGRLMKEVIRDLQAADSDATGPRRPALPGWVVEELRERTARQVDAVKESGVRVVGDVESLRLPEDLGGEEAEAEDLRIDVRAAASLVAGRMTATN